VGVDRLLDIWRNKDGAWQMSRVSCHDHQSLPWVAAVGRCRGSLP
jgi:hypothetical protein